jgi:hypothetical protein
MVVCQASKSPVIFPDASSLRLSRSNGVGPVARPRRHFKPFVVRQLECQHVQPRVWGLRMEAENISVRQVVPDRHQVLLKIPLAAQLEVLASGQARHCRRNILEQAQAFVRRS